MAEIVQNSLDPRLVELQAENQRLHQILAELLLQNQTLRDAKTSPDAPTITRPAR